MANFTEILQQQSSTIERPKPLPVGTYLTIVQGPPTHSQVGEKQTDALDFTLAVMAPQTDVDQVKLLEMGGAQGKTIRHRLFVTDDSRWRLKQFLVEHLAIEEGSKTLGELLAEAPGKQCYVTLRHRPAQDGSTVYAEVASTARV